MTFSTLGKAENLQKNLQTFKNALTAIGDESELKIASEVRVVDQSNIGNNLAAVVCSALSGCNDYILVSNQYLQTNRTTAELLNAAYHETLHFNDTRWNMFVTSKLNWFGITSIRHTAINKLGMDMELGIGTKNSFINRY